MHRLMGTSPVVDQSTIAHSGTTLNLNVIICSCKDYVGDHVGSDDEIESVSRVSTTSHLPLLLLNVTQAGNGWDGSPDWDENAFTTHNSTSPSNSQVGSPRFDGTPPPNLPVATLSALPVITPIITKPMPMSSQSAPQKWKVSYQDQIHETSELEQTNRLSIAQIQT